MGKMRVVVSHEQWIQTKVRGGKRVRTSKESHWRWLVSRNLFRAGAHLKKEPTNTKTQGMHYLTELLSLMLRAC